MAESCDPVESEGKAFIGCWLLKMTSGCRESSFISVSETFRRSTQSNM